MCASVDVCSFDNVWEVFMRCIAVACVRVLKTESENNDREFMFCSWQCCEKQGSFCSCPQLDLQ